VHSDLAIDYARGLETLAGQALEEIIRVIRDEMPNAWLTRYRRMCEGSTGVHAITVDAFDYLFDYCSDLPEVNREDRVVVAYGLSRSAHGRRNASRMRGWPGSDERGDRGHFVAHAAGGPLDLNLFHQDPLLNRGWSAEGKRYRDMERYVAEHEGTFFFSRPIYADTTARPAELEFGILMPEGRMWVELFANG